MWDIASFIGLGLMLGRVAEALARLIGYGPKAWLSPGAVFSLVASAYLGLIFGENIRTSERESPSMPEILDEGGAGGGPAGKIEHPVLVFMVFSGLVVPVLAVVWSALRRGTYLKEGEKVPASGEAIVVIVAVGLAAVWHQEAFSMLFLLMVVSLFLPALREWLNLLDQDAQQKYARAVYRYEKELRAYERGDFGEAGDVLRRPTPPRKVYRWRANLLTAVCLVGLLPFAWVLYIVATDPERLVSKKFGRLWYVRWLKKALGADRRAFDPFEIIGVKRGASKSDIKRAFRKRALELHPDKNPNDPLAQARFEQLQLANDVMTKPAELRKFLEKTRHGGASILVNRSVFIAQQAVMLLGMRIVTWVLGFLARPIMRRFFPNFHSFTAPKGAGGEDDISVVLSADKYCDRALRRPLLKELYPRVAMFEHGLAYYTTHCVDAAHRATPAVARHAERHATVKAQMGAMERGMKSLAAKAQNEMKGNKRDMEQALRQVPGMHLRRAVLELIHDMELLVRYARLNVAYQLKGLLDLYLAKFVAGGDGEARWHKVRKQLEGALKGLERDLRAKKPLDQDFVTKETVREGLTPPKPEATIAGTWDEQVKNLEEGEHRRFLELSMAFCAEQAEFEIAALTGLAEEQGSEGAEAGGRPTGDNEAGDKKND